VSQTTALTFTAQTEGYDEQAWRDITVTNNGTSATGALTITAPAGFSIQGRTGFESGIAAGSTRDFQIRPSRNLAPGTYSGTVTIAGSGGLSASFSVSFTVNASGGTIQPQPGGRIALSQTGTLTFPHADVGFGEFPWHSVTITNNGSTDTGALTITAPAGFSIQNRTAVSRGIAAGESVNFDIRPSRGINEEPGTYSGAVTVSGAGGISAGFNVSFTVNAPVVMPQSYQITLQGVNPASNDNLTLSANQGVAGQTISIGYTLSSSSTNSMLTFTGATGLSPITQAGSGTVEYTVNANDAVNGVIAIVATFTHTNLALRTLTFERSSQTITFGDEFVPNTISLSAGDGDITFSSSNAAVATVSSAGAITFAGAGTTTITASIAENATHSSATASYTLTLNRAAQNAPAELTATGQSAAGVNDGTITGVTGAMEFRTEDASGFTAITATPLVGLSPGTYYVRFAATATHDASAVTTLIVAAYGEILPTAFPVSTQRGTVACECCSTTVNVLITTVHATETTPRRERTVSVKRDENGNVNTNPQTTVRLRT
jgi:hypothetical protein